MNKDCDIKNNMDIKENPVQDATKRCLISQKVIFNSNNSSKSNVECITEPKKFGIKIK